MIKLDDVICCEYKIYVHTANGKEPETLQEHIERCKMYFESLAKEKQFDRIIVDFLNQYMGTHSESAEQIAREILDGIIIFHDIGKINPAFQKETMGQKKFPFEKYNCLGTRHSFFSSVIYLDYYYELIEKNIVKKTDKRKLKMLAYMGAYLISRHHSDLGNMEVYQNEFLENGQAKIIIEQLLEKKYPLYKGPFYFNFDRMIGNIKKIMDTFSQEQGIYNYVMIRFFYSVLVTVDYYATTEYMTGLKMKNFGNIDNSSSLIHAYESNELIQSIRNYEAEYYRKRDIISIQNMNELRNELFLETEKEWKEKQEKSLFFLEAPTGSGKSNVALNLSLQMQKTGQNKIFYIYPFNTLVEQNLASLKRFFGDYEEVFSKIAVINSVTPIKTEQKRFQDEEKYDYLFYQKALLDRQFLNYPFILTTHVNLFDIMFGANKESVFGFLQMANSVIILDEIQSYRNQIWSEIIIFLNAMAKLLRMKVVIMSATLPDLSYLTDQADKTVKLIKDQSQYFENPVFSQRVQLSYDLLKENMDLEKLRQHISVFTTEKEAVLIEFIKKSTAYQFYQLLCSEDYEKLDKRRVYLLTGDDNIMERTKILKEIEDQREGVILVATQVVEAGVDIDMDIGYKDISKLDSEEQFLGRVNRSYKRKGKVYFFNLDHADMIYKNDIRSNVEFTLKNSEMQEILNKKCFETYYHMILDVLKKNFNASLGDDGIETFFKEKVARGNFGKIAERMKLIEENDWNISVYLSRNMVLDDGTTLDGWACWNEYRSLLMDTEMDYAKKQILLSEIKVKMNYFIYEIKKNSNLTYSDRIGELYGIQDGEKYFINGKLDKKMLEENNIFIGI